MNNKEYYDSQASTFLSIDLIRALSASREEPGLPITIIAATILSVFHISDVDNLIKELKSEKNRKTVKSVENQNK